MLALVEDIRTPAGRNTLAPAMVTRSRVITYGELLDLIARISNHLTDRGVRRGAKLFLNIADADLRLVVMISAMHAGMVPFTLLQLGDDKSEVDFDAVVGIGDPFLPDVARDVAIDQAVISGPNGDPKLRDFPDRDDGDTLYVSSTTGTTGRRKLLAVTQGRFRLRRPFGSARFGPDVRSMVTLGGMTGVAVAYLFGLLAAGGTHVRVLPNVPNRLRLINWASVNWLYTTPETIIEMMDVMETLGVRCPSVTSISLTGSLVPSGLAERLEANFDAEAKIGYGTTEVGGIASGRLTAATFVPGYVGELVEGMTLISTGTPDHPAPIVVVGEFGYLADYVQGKTVPVSERMYTLPDLGYMKGGGLYLVGRDDEVINVDGNKVAFSLIERDLRSVGGVKDIAVVGGVSTGHPAEFFIAVVAAPETDLGALRTQLGKTLKAPAGDNFHVFRLARIPRNAMGKVDRAAVVAAQGSPT